MGVRRRYAYLRVTLDSPCSRSALAKVNTIRILQRLYRDKCYPDARDWPITHHFPSRQTNLTLVGISSYLSCLRFNHACDD
jgi:hypothetical protein